jgi:hypothetical protein
MNDRSIGKKSGLGFPSTLIDFSQLLYLLHLWKSWSRSMFGFIAYLNTWANQSEFRAVFPKQGSAEHRQGFREKSWNILLKILKYREKFQISLEISRGFLYGNWQYWRNLRALPTASLFCFGQFVFKVIFSCTVSVFVSYCYSAASPVTTERRALCQINFLDNTLAVIELLSPLSTFSGL